MKKLIFSLTAIAVLASACGKSADCSAGSGNVVSRTYETDDFSQLELSGSEDIYISQGSELRVEIEAQSNIHDELIAEVNSGKFQLKVKDCIVAYEPIKVYLTLPTLTELEVSGSGSIVVLDPYHTSQCHLSISGSGDIHHDLQCDELAVELSGSGDLYLEGHSSYQFINLSGSGDYYGLKLQSDTAVVNISGSGKAGISVNHYLHANLSGSGNLYYQGSPATAIITTGSGRVIQK